MLKYYYYSLNFVKIRGGNMWYMCGMFFLFKNPDVYKSLFFKARTKEIPTETNRTTINIFHENA